MATRAIVEQRGEELPETTAAFSQAHPTNPAVRLVGFWSAVIAAIITIAYAIVQPFTAPPTEWHGMAVYAASFNPITLTWLYPAFLLPLTFVVVIVSIHQATPEDDRLWTHLGVVSTRRSRLSTTGSSSWLSARASRAGRRRGWHSSPSQIHMGSSERSRR